MNNEEISSLATRWRRKVETPDGTFVVRRVNALFFMKVAGKLPQASGDEGASQKLLPSLQDVEAMEAALKVGVVDPRITFDGETSAASRVVSINDLSEETVSILLKAVTAFWEESAGLKAAKELASSTFREKEAGAG